MIFGSKALVVAVLGALVFSGEASASKLKDEHNNKGLRKAQEVSTIDNMAGDDSVDPDAVAPTCGDVGVSTLFFLVCRSTSQFTFPQLTSLFFLCICRSHLAK